MSGLFDKPATGPADAPPIPSGASDSELANHKLPCDVQIGNVVLRQGVPLLSLVAMARQYAEQLRERGRP